MLSTNKTTTVLIKAREYISDETKWCTNTLIRGAARCARGAVYEIIGFSDWNQTKTNMIKACDALLQQAARELYNDMLVLDTFHKRNYAHVFVNNELGHEATLKMFDRAIELSFAHAQDK